MKAFRVGIVLTAALALQIPVNTFAQPQSEIGLFSDETDLTTFSATVLPGMTILHLILINPYFNTDAAPFEPHTTPVSFISYFDGRIEVPSTYFVLGFTFPQEALNIGILPDFSAYFLEPLLVLDGRIRLATIALAGPGTDDIEIYLKPANDIPEIPGHMAARGAAQDGNMYAFIMYPISGDHDSPVFIFNPTGDGPVNAEPVSWSRVKTLYR